MTTKSLSDQSLQPIVDFLQDTHGAAARLVRLFNDGLDKPIQRTTIMRWLRVNPADRLEPYHGSAMRLHQAFVDLQVMYADKRNPDSPLGKL